MTGPLIFLVAGEPSGDALGASLMAGLRKLRPDVRFVGVGGERMCAEGLESLFPMADLAVMGLAEVVPRLPNLVRRIRQTAAEVERLRPAALVTIDAPDFSFRVARKLKGKGIPLIHYVAPTVWAWRPGRARKIARFLDHLLVLLPFEPPWFEREGLGCTFVGHPVVESGADRGDGARFRAAHGIPASAPLLCVLPGSRQGEVMRLLPVFAATLERLRASHPDLRVVVPTVANVAATVRRATWPVPAVVVDGQAEKYDAFAAADAALAASGTVALELALAGTPTVVAYRVNRLTAWLARRLIRVRWVNLVNILLDRGAVPELLQEACSPDRLADELRSLLDDEAARQAQRDAGGLALAMLGRGGVSPGDRAARAVLQQANQLLGEGDGGQGAET
ncbi:MAG: lipid-A-disaccharide synthase [Magnetospirillum sp. WYHS-4]